MAEIIDGKLVAEDVVATVKRLTAELVAQGPCRARPGRGHRRRGSGEPGLCRLQVARRPRNAASIPSSTRCRPTPARPRCSKLIADLNADPSIDGILVQLPLPGHIDAGKRHPDDLAREGCRRLPFRQCRQARHRRTRDRLRALHAGRLDAAHRARARQGPVGPQRGRRRPLQHRRQADGESAARRQLHGHHRAQPHKRPAGARAHRRHPGRRGRPARNGQGRLGKARRDRHRRRHQPRAGAGKGRGQVPAGRRRRLCRGREERRRHHAGAGRRRADDDRAADGQHAGLGLSHGRAASGRPSDADPVAGASSYADAAASCRHARSCPIRAKAAGSSRSCWSTNSPCSRSPPRSTRSGRRTGCSAATFTAGPPSRPTARR